MAHQCHCHLLVNQNECNLLKCNSFNSFALLCLDLVVCFYLSFCLGVFWVIELIKIRFKQAGCS